MEGKELAQYFESVKAKREKGAETIWKEIAPIMAPQRELLIGGQRDNAAKKYGLEIYDARAVDDIDKAADGFIGSSCDPSDTWLKLDSSIPEENDDRNNQEWFEVSRDIYLKEVARGQFYSALRSLVTDSMAFGNGHIQFIEDTRHNMVRFRSHNPAMTYIDVDEFGSVSAVFTIIPMTVKNYLRLEDEAVFENVPDWVDKVRKSDQPSDLMEEHDVIYYAYRNMQFLPYMGREFGNSQYITGYMDFDTSLIMTERGVDDIPDLYWRWRIDSGEAYGRGPGHNALRDVKALQNYSKREMQLIQRLADPAKFVPQDMKGKVSFKPGVINYYMDPKRPAMNDDVGGNYQVLQDAIMRKHQEIDTHFYRDIFLMLANMTNRKVTAEIVELQNEKMGVLAPQIASFTEHLRILVKRSFMAMMRMGIIPAPPGNFQGLRLNFLGPLPQAQIRMQKTNGIMRSASALTQLQPVFPNIFKRFNEGEIVKQITEGFGLPVSVLLTEAEFNARMEAEAQARQQQMAIESAKGVADAGQAPQQGSPGEALMNQFQRGA